MPADPQISPRHRLELTLFIAAAVHAVVILGVGFGIGKPPPPPPMSRMEVTLVAPHHTAKPVKVQALAQVTQQGGGDSKLPKRPSSPTSSPLPLPSRGAAQVTQAAKPAAPHVTPQRQLLATRHRAQRTAPSRPAIAQPPKLPSAADLMQRSLEMASLSAEIGRDLQTDAERPRQKYISASTREYKYAAYEEAWRLKVERIGNLNYPDEARRRNLSGELLMDVALNPDGSIAAIKVLRSSGHKILDDAARRIVRLAAPYAPFPPNIRSETDILHIIRTWKFESGYGLSSSR